MNFRSATVIAALAAAPLWAGAQNVHYSLTDLGTLGGHFSTGSAVNSNGEVTGHALTTTNQAHAFLYLSGAMQDLGTLGGTWSGGAGINSSGQVAGDSDTAGNNADHAFLYSNGAMQDLGTLGGTSSIGTGINSSGQVTGYASTAGNASFHAFLYSNGSMQDLGTLGGTSSAGSGINSSGEVTGYSSTKGNSGNHAFLYANGAMQDLGTLGGAFSSGTAVNSSGQVTGYAFTSGNAAIHAFIYTGGSMQDLGTLGGVSSEGMAINTRGDVTGFSFVAFARHAFIYSGGAMRDLNGLIDPSSPLAPYVTLTEGRAINDNGSIVADGIDSRTSETHAYLLIPPPEGVSDCAHVGDVAPLLDVVFERRTSAPDDEQASFTASEAEPGIVCVDNGVNGSLPVTAAWGYLNANSVVDPDDFTANSPPIQVRVNLLQDNELTFRLASKPGAEIRVRVFKALPVPR